MRNASVGFIAEHKLSEMKVWWILVADGKFEWVDPPTFPSELLLKEAEFGYDDGHVGYRQLVCS